ncbi:SDR family NAD(P)-dependent oxidoreductase [Sphingomonas sp. TF3]|uniref:SDR family NAD(P)-dependent oxidoreductase n=1 Tax=Sphingomonas sp. TF3 TaxID=2495580 RepID=UPI00163B7857|nr:SDR family NAD(P)-dependent oxidoreductase [Sphingomonas sp. TF3]
MTGTTDMFGLSGKTAIIWGGGQGMGESSAIYLGRAGCRLAIVDVNESRAGEAAARLAAQGLDAIGLVADITNESDVERATDQAEAALGPIDIMVTIVGASSWKPLLDVTDADWSRELDLNLKSVLYSARAAARRMLASGRKGTIIAVNSVSGLTSAPFHAPYGAAKAGLMNLVRSMAVEWGPDIRVNAVAPGTIVTQRLPKQASEDDPASPFRRRIPLQRRGTTDEIGKGVLFLASDLASYVTGQTLPVDGGWMAAWLFDVPTEASRPTKLAE